jgi:hypothetical protein
VRRLLRGGVDSFEKLEVLLALHALEAPQRAHAVAARTGVAVADVETAASELAGAGLLERLPDDTWGVPAAARQEGALDQLAAAWATERPAVLKLMTQRALERVRASAARAFADAFRLRRDDDGEDDA